MLLTCQDGTVLTHEQVCEMIKQGEEVVLIINDIDAAQCHYLFTRDNQVSVSMTKVSDGVYRFILTPPAMVDVDRSDVKFWHWPGADRDCAWSAEVIGAQFTASRGQDEDEALARLRGNLPKFVEEARKLLASVKETS